MKKLNYSIKSLDQSLKSKLLGSLFKKGVLPSCQTSNSEMRLGPL